MKGHDLELLKKLKQLREMSVSKKEISVSAQEDGFLKLSVFMPPNELWVKQPKWYVVEGDEQEQVKSVLKYLHSKETISSLGVDGFSPTSSLKKTMLLGSLEQLNNDYSREEHSFLNPLLFNLYQDGHALIKGFSLHEMLFGRLSIKRDDLDMHSFSLYASHFKPGPFTLELSLDTTNKTVKRFLTLEGKKHNLKQDAKGFLLNRDSVNSFKGEAKSLTAIIGALGRYHLDNGNDFSVQTDSVYFQDGQRDYFALYNASKDENYLIGFGEAPLSTQKLPTGVTYLDGDNPTQSLVDLVRVGIYDPSAINLHRTIKDFKSLQEKIEEGRKSPELVSALDSRITRLQALADIFDRYTAKETQRRYLTESFADMAEYAVVPANSEDPLLSIISNRLSANAHVRTYAQSDKFKRLFVDGSKKERINLLQNTVRNLYFSHQQNNDVNAWLYANHKSFCERQGVNFKLLQNNGERK